MFTTELDLPRVGILSKILGNYFYEAIFCSGAKTGVDIIIHGVCGKQFYPAITEFFFYAIVEFSNVSASKLKLCIYFMLRYISSLIWETTMDRRFEPTFTNSYPWESAAGCLIAVAVLFNRTLLLLEDGLRLCQPKPPFFDCLSELIAIALSFVRLFF